MRWVRPSIYARAISSSFFSGTSSVVTALPENASCTLAIAESDLVLSRIEMLVSTMKKVRMRMMSPTKVGRLGLRAWPAVACGTDTTGTRQRSAWVRLASAGFAALSGAAVAVVSLTMSMNREPVARSQTWLPSTHIMLKKTLIPGFQAS